ncbi:type II toxin-antitoxin system PemK/MazF family toxin [Actinoplanes sp. NEAU-A12]|uniref:Type II toxin-antitoxin system PemK/MazF family toxin n=1 Tax=Actinoplanes sandaracinus TaxID=3045177 RepID=A0ABT6WUS5_9ACTN|nr:type II toxin-antitoxin system PemK/MazF family toxin [Actinoplanes sandaracinus]MDI6103492.1 type II toxin-antitoxin system PemK/MazF family toxin [Actinoplanes sandaracinus]
MLKAFFRRLAGAPERQPAPARPRAAPRPAGPRPAAPRPATPPRQAAPPKPSRSVPVPKQGRQLAYSPNLDGDADPGEIVWTWVPYEDDPAQGKDRPVLVVGRDARTLLGLMLSSQSERDGQRHWLALGPGGWDDSARPSWVRLDRVLEVDEDGIRREGAVLDRPRFDRIAAILRRNYGWP